MAGEIQSGGQYITNSLIIIIIITQLVTRHNVNSSTKWSH